MARVVKSLGCNQVDESMKEKFPPKTTSNEVNDELDYCCKVITVIETEPQIAEIPAVKEKLNVLKEVFVFI